MPRALVAAGTRAHHGADGAVLSSANISELAGLRWKHINLTPEWTVIDGDGPRSFTMAIRQHFTRGEVAYAAERQPPAERTAARGARGGGCAPQAAPEVPPGPRIVVFAGRSGTPVNQNNVRAPVCQSRSRHLGLTRLSWHVASGTASATFTESTGMGARDRQALMGHGSLEMTDRYTAEDQDRMRRGLDKVSAAHSDFPKERVAMRSKFSADIDTQLISRFWKLMKNM